MTTTEYSTRLGNLNRKISNLQVKNRKEVLYTGACRKNILKLYLLGWWKEIADNYTVGSTDNNITELQLKSIFTESEKLVV